MPKMKPKKNLKDQTENYVFENTLEHLPGMVFRCINDSEWTMLYLSQGTFEVTGYTAEELMDEDGPSLPSLIDADDHERVWEEVQTGIKSQQPYEFIHRFNTKNGEQKWVMVRAQAKYTAEYYNNPAAALPKLILEGIILDITQQKQAELDLLQSKMLQRSIIDGSIEGILIHRVGKPLFVNKSFLKMLGYDSYQEILALDSVAALIAPHEHERIFEYAQARIKGEFAPEDYEFEALHRDGSIRCMEIKSSTIDWKGQPAILSTLINVTERKRAQQQTEQQRQQLSHTNRLNMLGEMTAGIAHEINQPLTAIASRCAAAKNRINRDNPDLGKIKEALNSIEEQALRSGEIIKQLRSLVKTKDNKFQTVDLNELLDTCLKFIKMEGLFDRVSISTNIAAHLPAVMGDPVQIQQVVLNLIRNANDAMLHLANPVRCLSLSAIRHDDSAVQISVMDSGEGISEEQETKLFESFYTTKSEGMGMGLSISRTIIAAHKGRLWFSRNPDKGVTFRFTLPIHFDKEILEPELIEEQNLAEEKDHD